jgi:hypothetical protein
VRAASGGPWLLCGDFNLIYKANDKNNGRLDHANMRRFRGIIDDLQLEELHLSGRLFTWSNGRDQPTLERLDRAFASLEWLEQFSSYHLQCLSSDCSDHAPLLLVLNSEPWARPRFRFDQYWTRIEEFVVVVKTAWGGRLVNADVCRCLDHKLRALAKALQSWRTSCVGNIRSDCNWLRPGLSFMSWTWRRSPDLCRLRRFCYDVNSRRIPLARHPSSAPWLSNAQDPGISGRVMPARNIFICRPAIVDVRTTSSPYLITGKRSVGGS